MFKEPPEFKSSKWTEFDICLANFYGALVVIQIEMHILHVSVNFLLRNTNNWGRTASSSSNGFSSLNKLGYYMKNSIT